MLSNFLKNKPLKHVLKLNFKNQKPYNFVNFQTTLFTIIFYIRLYPFYSITLWSTTLFNLLNVFNFFQNKTPISEVFPKSFVDIHSHLLPGIDDGSKNMENTIELISKMRSYGINNFITTPHVLGNVWPNSSSTILEKLDSVKKELSKQGMNDINIHAAAEYMLDEEFSKLLKVKDILTLKDNYILVEMSFLNAPVNLFELLFDIQLAGYKPILAHPERYNFYHNKFDMYEKLIQAGCSLQMNLLSLTGYYGDSVKKTAQRLLKENKITFLGSDTHHMRHLEFLNKLGTKKNLSLLKPVLENNQLFI